MDNRLEIINALLSLSKQCEHLASLLDNNILNELSPETEVIQLPDSTVSIDIQQFELWPEAVQNPITHWKTTAKLQADNIGFDLSNSRIIEYSNGPSIPIGHAFHNTDVDLVCNTFKFGNSNPPGVKIINSLGEACGPYDIGIIYESLEFDDDPTISLIKIKQLIRHNGKIFIRFRPWPSRDGGFQSGHFNKAFAHLLMNIESNDLIKNKVIRPLAIYESLLHKAKLQILSRKVKSVPPEEFIIKNCDYMDILIKRTWGTIKLEDAIKIMATTAVDFLVQV